MISYPFNRLESLAPQYPCVTGCINGHCLSFTSVPVIKYPDKSHIREKGWLNSRLWIVLRQYQASHGERSLRKLSTLCLRSKESNRHLQICAQFSFSSSSYRPGPGTGDPHFSCWLLPHQWTWSRKFPRGTPISQPNLDNPVPEPPFSSTSTLCQNNS